MFDGVHLGHRKLIYETIDIAKQTNATPLVYTFENHPIKESKRKFLTTLDEKIFLIEKLGIEVVYIAQLNGNFMKMTPLEFVENELIKKLNVKDVIVGENFKFGYKKSGDVNTLTDLGKRFGFNVVVVKPVTVNNTIVSSSLIHDLIKEGDIETANKLLGHTFFVQGVVTKGKGRGKHLGFPTANLNYENHSKLIPSNGVYITITEVNDVFLKSVTSVGFNPTFEEKHTIHIESHVLDVEENFYGQFIRIHFLKKIRDEIKFENVSDLRKTVLKDIETTKEFFNKNDISSIKIY